MVAFNKLINDDDDENVYSDSVRLPFFFFTTCNLFLGFGSYTPILA